MSKSTQRQSQVAQPESTERKPYHAPCLEDYGEVRELTRTLPVSPYYGDGGTFPSVYSSQPD